MILPERLVAPEGAEMMSPPPQPSPRAKQIAEGLVRTGRASSDVRQIRTWLQLRATAGNFYWISLDGALPLRGEDRKSTRLNSSH